jgi:protoporphyrinogen oxidase
MLGILGGGLSGLALAYFYGRDDVEVLEKEERVGGLCRSYQKDGFHYDQGGHIIFSWDREILDLMLKVLGENAQRFYRNNKIWYKGRFVKYPFENGLGDLPREDIFECLYYYLRNDYPEPTNFKEWIYYTFGKGIAEKYLIPYNEKIWKTKTEEMGLDWVGGRVPKPPLADVIRSAIGIETEGYTHQLYFYYPCQGGIEALPRAFAAGVRGNIVTNFEVKSVGQENGRWVVSDGFQAREYDRLVCAMPIFALLDALEDVPGEVRQAAQALRYNSLLVVLVGLRDCVVKDKFAVYFHQPELLFHRLCFYHYLSEDRVLEGRYSAVAEITTAGEGDIWAMSDGKVAEKVIAGLEREGFIKTVDVLSTDVTRIKYAYVVYDLDHKRNVGMVKSYVRDLGIELAGRFAEFEYLNMDACVTSAWAAANRLNQR